MLNMNNTPIQLMSDLACQLHSKLIVGTNGLDRARNVKDINLFTLHYDSDKFKDLIKDNRFLKDFKYQNTPVFLVKYRVIRSEGNGHQLYKTLEVKLNT